MRTSYLRVASLLASLLGVQTWGIHVAASEVVRVQVSQEEMERQLNAIINAPEVGGGRRTVYKGPLAVPPSSEEALRARKEETLRQFEEQQRLDLDRELRDTLRQR